MPVTTQSDYSIVTSDWIILDMDCSQIVLSCFIRIPGYCLNGILKLVLIKKRKELFRWMIHYQCYHLSPPKNTLIWASVGCCRNISFSKSEQSPFNRVIKFIAWS